MLAPAFLLPLEIKKKPAGKTSLPFHEELLQQLISNPAISALPYRPSSRKTRSRSLLACRGRVRSRCPAGGRTHTPSPGLIVQSTRGSSRLTRFRQRTTAPLP